MYTDMPALIIPQMKSNQQILRFRDVIIALATFKYLY